MFRKNNIGAGVLISICLLNVPALAQQPLTQGSELKDIAIRKVLNQNPAVTTFNELASKVTIIDFFGTWCVPCLKALPQLEKIKKAFRDDLSVVLVSSEKEEQLQRFLAKRDAFVFPVIVDETGEWNAAFQPPSLPYTVVVKEGSIIAITTAEKITDDAIQSWLSTTVKSTISAKPPGQNPAAMSLNSKSANGTVRLSQDLVYAAKTGESVKEYLSQLSSLSHTELAKRLVTDNEKKTFWINLYNGYTQAALKANPDQYKNRNAFFKAKRILFAGESLSLDDIEHGILRHSKIKWSLGYVDKLFPSKREKALRVGQVDYRIHFALNCGAKSCPPIAFYNDETLDLQLDLATKAYLSSEVQFDPETNIVRLPKLMSWFRADFGGKKGMKEILKGHGIIPAGANPKIRFREYDWTLVLNN